MDTKTLERFATQARRELITAVEAQAAVVLAAGSVARSERAETVKRLEAEIAAHGQKYVIDKVAYTWFNRLIALRYMDVHGYTSARVVSPAQGHSHGQPEILADAKRGHLDIEVVTITRTRDSVMGLLDGSRRSADAEGEAYALLLTEYCRFWNKAMPFMFEREGDYTELLVPSGLLTDGAILTRAREVLTEEVCEDVEVIGWLYQFYISERKDEVFARFKENKKAGADEVPAATQLFTPHWIVRYLLENSLGRLWMLNRPASRLVDQMDYYIAPVDEETDFLKINGPEELTVIDPACGSGHMLTYAFDLLYAIYEEEGYAPSEIPSLILTHNLHGTEIDLRAGALAAFALTMKARDKDRRFLSREVEPHVCVIEPIEFGPDELDFLVTKSGDRHTEEAFWNQFRNAGTLGSLIQPDPDITEELARHAAVLRDDGDLIKMELLRRAAQVVRQAQYLLPRYEVLVANPPYMGSGNMGDSLAAYASRNYKTSKYDLFAMFIERSFGLVRPLGYTALVTMEAWMTGSVYSKFRSSVIFKQDLRSLVHLPYLGKGRTAMGINFGITAMIMRRAAEHRARSQFQCIRHYEIDEEGIPVEFPVRNDRESVVGLDSFVSIPGQPLIYAATPGDLAALASRPKVGNLLTTREGLTTGDNDRFMRRWFEVSFNRIAPSSRTGEEGFAAHRWYLYVKGGEFRRWYGNFDFVVDWEFDGRRVKENIDHQTGRVRSHNYNGDYAFLAGLSWSGMSSSRFSARFVPAGYMFDAKGPMGFAHSRTDLLASLAVLNSGPTDRYLGMLAPNLDFKLGHVLNLPVPSDAKVRTELAALADEAVGVAKTLWDETETSLDFAGDPLLSRPSRIEDRTAMVTSAHEAKSERLAGLKGRIDGALLEAVDGTSPVGLSIEPEPEPEVEVITVGDRVRSLISYAVGCMFGRYSLDEPGLILAEQGSTLQDFLAKVPMPSFTPDADNVIPFVDDGWFQDDIVDRFRQFLRTAFGAEYFEENFRFVEDSLGVKTIRDYFIAKSNPSGRSIARSKFYDDHVRRYKKRPIYWMFSSPKGSFNALIYLHRYTPATVSRVLNEYLREYRAKLEVALQRAEETAAGAASAKGQKEADRMRAVLSELRDYEHDVLYPLDIQTVEIDLDDGVKANYPKFAPALRPVKGLEAS